ncbi:hypothetical protein GCM10028781_11710 [Nostocoides australiense]
MVTDHDGDARPESVVSMSNIDDNPEFREWYNRGHRAGYRQGLIETIGLDTAGGLAPCVDCQVANPDAIRLAYRAGRAATGTPPPEPAGGMCQLNDAPAARTFSTTNPSLSARAPTHRSVSQRSAPSDTSANRYRSTEPQ